MALHMLWTHALIHASLNASRSNRFFSVLTIVDRSTFVIMSDDTRSRTALQDDIRLCPP